MANWLSRRIYHTRRNAAHAGQWSDYAKKLTPQMILYSHLDAEPQKAIAQYLSHSKAQLAQDPFALTVSGVSPNNYFVEFGAGDGIFLSNTWLLEKHLGWQGLLAEPAKVWHKSLFANRCCIIDTRCLSSKFNELVAFAEVVSDPKTSTELSIIIDYANNGDWASGSHLSNSQTYNVQSVSLDVPLDSLNSPGDISFLSVDTEGSENDILKNFLFAKEKLLRFVLNTIITIDSALKSTNCLFL